jgi:hypothetical protein
VEIFTGFDQVTICMNEGNLLDTQVFEALKEAYENPEITTRSLLNHLNRLNQPIII